MSAFAEFERMVREIGPRTAVVLGSGLGDATERFRQTASIAFADIPGLVPTTVQGHKGRLALGLCGKTPALLFLGRLHFYEGHGREVVTGTVRVAANLGIKRLVLTNAAGGIHPSLTPGALMAIRAHIKIVGRDAWRDLPKGDGLIESYNRDLMHAMREHEAEIGRELPVGVYVALTGPCYETPAEIRALVACGADAVGMSTALEAEAAKELGLEVAAISCITNQAAGFGGESLDHADVLVNAKLALERLGGLLTATVDMM